MQPSAADFRLPTAETRKFLSLPLLHFCTRLRRSCTFALPFVFAPSQSSGLRFPHESCISLVNRASEPPCLSRIRCAHLCTFAQELRSDLHLYTGSSVSPSTHRQRAGQGLEGDLALVLGVDGEFASGFDETSERPRWQAPARLNPATAAGNRRYGAGRRRNLWAPWRPHSHYPGRRYASADRACPAGRPAWPGR
jgi:hypothetical protein